MKRMTVVLGLLALLAVSAYAQQPVMKADIPFPFTAGNTVLPAGSYEFLVQNSMLTVRNLKTKNDTVMVPVLTRLAAESGGSVRITFDTIGEKHFLEAVWPAAQDGYLLHQTKDKHTHTSVKAG